MEIQAVIDLRTSLNEAITNILRDFEEHTSCDVSSITLRRVTEYEDRLGEIIAEVNVEVGN